MNCKTAAEAHQLRYLITALHTPSAVLRSRYDLRRPVHRRRQRRRFMPMSFRHLSEVWSVPIGKDWAMRDDLTG